MGKIGRNEPCFCGSGLKFKKCHGFHNRAVQPQDQRTPTAARLRAVADAILRDPRFRITYFIPHPDQDLREAFPFQLYTAGIIDTAHLIESACKWPADIRELSAHPRDRLLFRILRRLELRLLPIEYSALSQLLKERLGPFVAVVTTTETCEPVSRILEQSAAPMLHISEQGNERCLPLGEVSNITLHDFAIRAIASYRKKYPEEANFCTASEEILTHELDQTVFSSVCNAYRHGVTAPNEAALAAFGYKSGIESPLAGEPREAFIDALDKSARAVQEARLSLLRDDAKDQIQNLAIVAVASPAWVFGSSAPDFSRVNNDKVRRSLRIVWSAIKRQRDFVSQLVIPENLEFDPRDVEHLVLHRRNEMRAFVASLCAHAARELTPVLRLEPRINEVRPLLIQLAGCARGNGPHRRFKLQKLFERLCQQLRESIADRLLANLEEAQTRIQGLKLVGDLPLEVIPVSQTLLTLKFDCSRIPTTPGNMSLGEQLWSRQIVMPRRSFETIQVIRSFDKSDPLRGTLEDAVRKIDRDMMGKVEFKFTDVNSPDELVHAVNSHSGAILILDCHGQKSASDGAGTIVINGSQMHLFEYRKELQVSPIVLFSACDTFPMDGSHGSSAAGMLLVGARSVLGTTLPIDALHEAAFIARLGYRIGELLPRLLKFRSQGIDWRSFLAGMLRMTHVTEVLMKILSDGAISHKQLDDVQYLANMEINTGNPDWYRVVETRIASHSGQTDGNPLCQLTDSLAHVQLGHPESILIVENLPEEIIAAGA
jgi:hypothetical protein